jgi:hypothetical protein
MRLKEHPKIQWPPRCAEWGESSFRAEEGILRDVNLIEPMRLLLSNEMDGKVYLPKPIVLILLSLPDCTKKSSPLWGRPIREVGGTRFLGEKGENHETGKAPGYPSRQ